MAIKQTRPYQDLIPADLAELREEVRQELLEHGEVLSDPGWYVGRVREANGNGNGNGHAAPQQNGNGSGSGSGHTPSSGSGPVAGATAPTAP